jgi:hypothetical protein
LDMNLGLQLGDPWLNFVNTLVRFYSCSCHDLTYVISSVISTRI